MKMFYKILLLFLYSGINLSAQHFTINILPINGNDVNYSLVVKIKADSTTKSILGNATFRFSYDSDKLFFPRRPSKGSDYSFDKINSKVYSCTVTKPAFNTISINIFYKGGNPILISDSQRELAKINFRKQSNSTDYKFDHFKPEFFSPSSSIEWDIKVEY